MDPRLNKDLFLSWESEMIKMTQRLQFVPLFFIFAPIKKFLCCSTVYVQTDIWINGNFKKKSYQDNRRPWAIFLLSLLGMKFWNTSLARNKSLLWRWHGQIWVLLLRVQIMDEWGCQYKYLMAHKYFISHVLLLWVIWDYECWRAHPHNQEQSLLRLELDSTLSQSRIEFWNWIFNF